MSDVSYRNLIEKIREGIIAVDKGWQIVYINKFAGELLRQSPDSLIGKNLWKEFPEAVGKTFYHAYHNALQLQKTVQVEDFSATLGKWIQASIYPSTNGLSVYFHDITEQKKAEIKARESENKYRVFLERVTDAFIALDKNYCYTYLNTKAGELIGKDPLKLIGKNVWEVFPDAVGSETYLAFQKAMKEQRPITNLDYYAPLNLWQENYIYPSSEGLSVFIKDVSERKRLEKELLDQKVNQQRKITVTALEAQEKERNHIGQELHDNVNQILVSTKLILDYAKESNDTDEAILQKCINNLDRVIEENRKISHELVTPDLMKQSLVDELSNLIQPMLGASGIKATITVLKYHEGILDQPRKLTVYRIAQEQCTNILKYAKAKNVVVTLDTSNEEFTMNITDDGQGMQRTKTKKGIGLRNIEGRVSIFNGSMKIETKPGKGFTLQICLPLVPIF